MFDVHGVQKAALSSEFQTAIAPRNAVHPRLPLLAAATASGRVHLCAPPSRPPSPRPAASRAAHALSVLAEPACLQGRPCLLGKGVLGSALPHIPLACAAQVQLRAMWSSAPCLGRAQRPTCKA